MNTDETTVIIKVHGRDRKGFKDPVNFEWTKNKDDSLWQEISKSAHINNIDWSGMCLKFQAPEYFIKKRVYYLFSRQIEMLETVKESVLNKRVLERNSVTSEIDPLNYVGREEKNTSPLSSPQSTVNRLPSQSTINGIVDAENHGNMSSSDSSILASNINQLQPGIKSIREEAHPHEFLFSNSGTSSTASISKSALEEALLDKLNISD